MDNDYENKYDDDDDYDIVDDDQVMNECDIVGALSLPKVLQKIV